jgi:hypothetical protein
VSRQRGGDREAVRTQQHGTDQPIPGFDDELVHIGTLE